MQLDHSFYRLPIDFDADRLAQEVAAIPDTSWVPHPQGFAHNDALLLISRNGDPRDDSLTGPQFPTPNLDALPYLKQVLASLRTTWGRTRLMRIGGQAEVARHMDAHYYWHERMRVHVPIVTHPDVSFHAGDDQVHMGAGECWVFDTWKQHQVCNPSDNPRIHLVADTTGSAFLWDLVRRAQAFPSSSPDTHMPLTRVNFRDDWDPVIATEQYNAPYVMTPWEIRRLSDRIFHSVPADAPQPALAEVYSLVQRMIEDWQATWGLFADEPRGVDAFRLIHQRIEAALAPYKGHITLYNRMDLVTLLQKGVLNVLINEDAQAHHDAAPDTATHTTTHTTAGRTPVTPVNTAPPRQVTAQAATRFDRPVFIVASPRSGSTMLYEALCQSPGFFSLHAESHAQFESISALQPEARPDNSNRLTAQDATDALAQQLRSNFYAALKDHTGCPAQPQGAFRFLEKTPKNALRITFLKQVFPDARFIYLHRQPEANIASIIDAWQSGKFVTYPTLPDWDGPSWSLLLPPDWHTLKGQPLEKLAAWQWAQSNRYILDDLASLPDSDWCSVSYEALCLDPATTLRALCDFAEVPMPATDAELPLSRHTLTPPSPDKWKKHQHAIDQTRSVWAPIATRIRERLATSSQAAPAVAQPAAGHTDPHTPYQIPAAAPAADRHPAPVQDFSSVHTQSMPRILSELGISLLVTTYQAGKLIVVREDQGKVNTHFRIFNKPMGLAGNYEKFAMGTLNEIREYRNMPAVAPKLEPKNRHDSCFIPRQRHITGDVDIHEMAYDKDDQLWYVNTRFSCLCTLDYDHSFVPSWRPPFITGYAPEDRCHLNGLAMKEGKPKYVTMLGRTNEKGGWRANKRNGGLIMDTDDYRIISDGLSMPHSPRWYRDQLWVLESGYGSLAKVDLDTGETHPVCTLPGFTRGIDFVGDLAFIGLSQVRETAVFSGLPLTESTAERFCGVWVVNILSGEVLGFLRFEGSVQEIFSVQVVHGARFPEVLEDHDPMVSASYALPDEALKDVDFDSIERHRREELKKREEAEQQGTPSKDEGTHSTSPPG